MTFQVSLNRLYRSLCQALTLLVFFSKFVCGIPSHCSEPGYQSNFVAGHSFALDEGLG